MNGLKSLSIEILSRQATHEQSSRHLQHVRKNEHFVRLWKTCHTENGVPPKMPPRSQEARGEKQTLRKCCELFFGACMRGACGRFQKFPPLPKKTVKKANPDESVASFPSEHACVELAAVSAHFRRYPKRKPRRIQERCELLFAACMRGACGRFDAFPQCTNRRTKIRRV